MGYLDHVLVLLAILRDSAIITCGVLASFWYRAEREARKAQVEQLRERNHALEQMSAPRLAESNKQMRDTIEQILTDKSEIEEQLSQARVSSQDVQKAMATGGALMMLEVGCGINEILSLMRDAAGADGSCGGGEGLTELQKLRDDMQEGLKSTARTNKLPDLPRFARALSKGLVVVTD